MKRCTLTLTALLITSLLFTACSDRATLADIPESEEAPLRDVYALTMTSGSVAKAITERGAVTSAAVTPQNISTLSADAEASVLYINADSADLRVMKQNNFLRQAVDNSVPVILEASDEAKLAELTFDLFGFSLPGKALLVAKDIQGGYSATPIGQANDVNAVLDAALPRSQMFQAASKPIQTEEVDEGTLTSQRTSIKWIEGPNAITDQISPEKLVYVWAGQWQGCPGGAADNCPMRYDQAWTDSHTWAVTVNAGIDGIGLGDAANLAFSVSTSYSRTQSYSWTISNTVAIAPGQYARPQVEVLVTDRAGHFEGKQSVRICDGIRCSKKRRNYERTITGANAAQYDATWSGQFPQSQQFTRWYIQDDIPR